MVFVTMDVFTRTRSLCALYSVDFKVVTSSIQSVKYTIVNLPSRVYLLSRKRSKLRMIMNTSMV